MDDKAQIAQQIFPGICPPEGCPPPTRIECIAVDKVYDSCFQVHDITRTTTVPLGVNLGTGFTNNGFEVGDLIERSEERRVGKECI